MTKRARRAAGSFGAMTEERHPHDLYETPYDAVEMLVKNHWTEGTSMGIVWDPSCGRGALIDALRRQRHAHLDGWMGTDKFKYKPLRRGLNLEFNKPIETTLVGNSSYADVIIMNPPYGDSDAHVGFAIEASKTGSQVIALMRLNWMAAKKRAEFLPYLKKLIIVGRVKMLPPGVADKGHSGTVDFAWFVFSRHGTTSTMIIRA